MSQPTEAGQVTNFDGKKLTLYMWDPIGDERGVAVVYHGYATHAKYPTVQWAADVLVACGLRCYAADLPGHGSSEGTPGLMCSVAEVTQTGLSILQHVRGLHSGTKVLLCGTSMGGAVALNVSRQEAVDGLVLLAPMVKQNASNVPAAPVVMLLQFIARVAPSWAVISSNATNDDVQYSDPERRAQCQGAAGTYSGKLRLGTAATLLGISTELHDHLEEISCPFFVAVGGREVVVDPQGIHDLYNRAATPTDKKTLKDYPDAQHGLLAEPLPLRTQIESDIRTWVSDRLILSQL